ncbi:MAG: phosphoribosylamine--glycine ligase [Alphaproteobacteria bacterium]|nr:phosphoribosylamine--glycine ligase [Alphaproteobacteria bacterium]
MNVLVIGGGGREHALCWKLRQSPKLDRLFCAPGNAGIARDAECVAVNPSDHDAVIAFCRANDVELVVVGPEQPLVEGLVDSLTAAGIRAFGPTAKAAQLEGSKGFTKDLCARHGIPTAAYRRFTEATAARDWALARPLPVVVKADGLAAGKGVVVAATHDEAIAHIDAIFADADAALVIEDFLAGEEASFFAIVDGADAVAFGSAGDHKRVGDGDTGPNTGGMGAFCPAPIVTPALEREVMERIVLPTARAMVADGMPFRGVLFAGLMIGADGPQLIEFNTRFGDPECEVLMARLGSDLLDLLLAACDGRLADVRPEWRAPCAATVVMAAEGYPGTPKKGTPIRGVEAAEAAGAIIFHAGTARDSSGGLVANGGRVLAVTAIGDSMTAAISGAYKGVDAIDWPGGFCRRDIGRRAIG